MKMEALKKLRRLAKPNDWCFSFDLRDGFYALGIHRDFQKFTQFDIQGELFQCSAMSFGWSDAPRVFCKFVRVMVEALRSPQAAEDRRARNEKKGQWDPVQIIEHLGLEAFLRELEGKIVRLYCDNQVDDDKFYPGVVKGFNEDGTVHVVYDDGDEENLNLSDEKFTFLRSAGVSEQNDETAEVLNENTDCGGDYEENKRGGDTQNFFVRSLCGRWKSEAGSVSVY
ncbi:hypothetical protein CYMTET_46386 [Cymbomonas tetramitiformis]|uniref:Uncharacterized protein n=1 Tax=Cymbomonas tetramitiformis TaxID=36881 RepID=A0AAE0BW85_9CHLO|nr:hypothetical protein CYMTET_46386 [Cymbomonas tetramitiformis]